MTLNKIATSRGVIDPDEIEDKEQIKARVAPPDDGEIVAPLPVPADQLTIGSSWWREAMINEGRDAELANYDFPTSVNPAPTNDELQSELDAQREFDETSQPPTQPYVLESSAFRSDMTKRKAVLDNDIALLEGQRDGMNARIDDMNATRVAVQAALDVLK